MHEKVDQSAINEANQDGAVNQDLESTTSEVVRGCGSERAMRKCKTTHAFTRKILTNPMIKIIAPAK